VTIAVRGEIAGIDIFLPVTGSLTIRARVDHRRLALL
jgi:hypothetical protein